MNIIHPSISYHTGSGGNATGIGDHSRALAAAGIPIVTTAADAFMEDAQEIARLTPDLDHVIIFRRTIAHAGSLPPSGSSRPSA